MFVDRAEIETQGGKGGDGCLSFRRERYVPHGGPDGGDGGDGGSVIIRAKSGVNSLASLSNRRTWKAPKGTHGSGSNRHGRNGEDIAIDVPPGTVIIDAKEKFVIRDLANLDDEFVVAHGGKGGRGNAHFKSSTNQAPREFSLGAEGESRRVILELKMIADVGLVGKPNAGKSTLLSRLSSAKPEIASYPFTTKYPNLGLVQVDSEHSFVMADIPGLIEGAHSGAGLGFDFLKHIERTGILIHLVEPEPMDQTDPVQNYLTIKDEMVQYNAALGHRPEIVVVSKCELPGADSVAKTLGERIGREVLLISAATGQGLNRLTRDIANLLYAREK
jgi:GTP-binding protein